MSAQRLFDTGGNVGHGVVYICSQLAVIVAPEEVQFYHTFDYFVAACGALNSATERFIFVDFRDAEYQLQQLGPEWCIYELNLPTRYINQRNTPSSLVNYEFKPHDLQEVYFHHLSVYAQNKMSPG